MIVRNLNQVEIRRIDDSFSVANSFKSIGDEVLATDIYNNNLVLNEELDNISVKKNDQYVKVQDGRDGNEVIAVQEEKYSILLLDIDGNVNVWESNNISTKFNLYDIPDINIEHKKKQFFSMGYPYFIKANSTYYAISTDHGVFAIRKD